MKKLTITTVCIVMAIFSVNEMAAQNVTATKTTIAGWDGMAVAGYVNNGGFVNFGGPTVKLIKKPFSFGFGILPTMRIKDDKVAKGSPKNSIITPTAGFGFTLGYKHLVVQVPFYYNAKTATIDGQWNSGVGIGYKF